MDRIELHIFNDGRRGGDYLDSLVGVEGWRYTESGKPVLVDGGYVSWSYSEGCMAFVMSDVEVGVDMERRMELPYEIEDYGFVLSDRERARVLTAYDLFRVWARKEAYVKMGGTGLVDDLHLVCTYEKSDNGLVYFSELVRLDYVISVCTRSKRSVDVIVHGD